MIIIPGLIRNWQVAKKTKPVKAKPLVSILVDKSVLSKLFVTTLEANEPLGDGAVICVGEVGDIWQQMPKKLLAKYDVAAIDAEGWMVCEPKPDNSINCFEVPSIGEVRSGGYSKEYPDDRAYNMGYFCIDALWGDAGYPAFGKNIQWGSKGDFICQNRTDPNDVWVVRRKFFQNTYAIIGEFGG